MFLINSVEICCCVLWFEPLFRAASINLWHGPDGMRTGLIDGGLLAAG